MKFTDT